MPSLLKKLLEYFTPNYSSELDSFVLSKKPVSVVEMEFWVREYDRKNASQGWIL